MADEETVSRPASGTIPLTSSSDVAVAFTEEPDGPTRWDAGDVGGVLPFDPQRMNAKDAVEAVSDYADMGYQTLLVLRAREAMHPQYEHGRTTVMAAIAGRLRTMESREPAPTETEAAPAEAVYPGERAPEAGESVLVRTAAGTVPAKFVGFEIVARVWTTQGHPRDLLIERADVLPG